jgi:ssRNA-specific RNase YbeY (16S rRNA maturation enzyme)
VHGVLHLRGHDDHEPAARRRMLAAEKRVLATLGYEVPDRA